MVAVAVAAVVAVTAVVAVAVVVAVTAVIAVAVVIAIAAIVTVTAIVAVATVVAATAVVAVIVTVIKVAAVAMAVAIITVAAVLKAAGVPPFEAHFPFIVMPFIPPAVDALKNSRLFVDSSHSVVQKSVPKHMYRNLLVCSVQCILCDARGSVIFTDAKAGDGASFGTAAHEIAC